MTYTLEQAQTNLAQLLAEAQEGKDVVIEQNGKPTVRLQVVEEEPLTGPRIPGQYAGQFQYPDDFFKPLETDEELREYGFDIMIDGKSPNDPLDSPE
ncbi:MAG TPA: type II toxin-antitoxin system prevent-host-death family antitoxin [Acidobacteriaceae bacterium]|jgi:prevent-host-death family protein|nr:type II toxin-antitoxin system prevent-host-death family antitoxin [Acidobacteriaceae bacterium]